MLHLYLFATVAGGLLCAVSLVSGLSRGFAGHVWTYLLAFVGAGGLVLRLLLAVREPFAGLLALGFGLLGGRLVRDLVRRAAPQAEPDPPMQR